METIFLEHATYGAAYVSIAHIIGVHGQFSQGAIVQMVNGQTFPTHLTVLQVMELIAQAQ